MQSFVARFPALDEARDDGLDLMVMMVHAHEGMTNDGVPCMHTRDERIGAMGSEDRLADA